MTDLGSRALSVTPLHARTAELCATNNWTEQQGFTVPALYASLREEHEALSERVALSDLSARQCWVFDGPDAAAFLSFATLADVTRLEIGQTAHTLWCDDQGFVRGEGVIARFAPAQFELSTIVRDLAWMIDAVKGFDLKLTNVTGTRAIIGVRGPFASMLLAVAGFAGEPGGAGSVTRPAWRPAQVALTRNADGLELSSQADDGAVVWDRLWRAGAGLGIAAVGATALETFRIEMATPRPGIDWRPAQLAKDAADLRLPTDLGQFPDLTRRFNGADALRRITTQGRQVLVHFTADEPLSPGPLTARNTAIGRLTSCTWSESQASAFALGWLDADSVKPGTKLQAQGGRAEILKTVFAV
ncbi:MAG: aminomethyltransferase family protein [Alphaproteobacteria bacterium]|nr:aminomethyltransferase family protein [Alphaproteobacteria bacterium]